MPHRIQRQRTRGWRMPDGAAYVGRPTPFGNPFRIDRWGDISGWLGWYVVDPCLSPNATPEYLATQAEARARAVQLYREWAAGRYEPWNGQGHISIDRAHYVPGWVREQAPVRLAGRDLACWCPLGKPCHADVLLALANPPAGEAEA